MKVYGILSNPAAKKRRKAKTSKIARAVSGVDLDAERERLFSEEATQGQ